MNRKVIIGILVGVIIIIGMFTVIKNNSINNETVNQAQEVKNIEEKLKQALEESKESYINYGKKNFEVYFGIDFLNEKFMEGRINLETNLENKMLDDIEIYSLKGEKIDKFPTVNYEKDTYKIEQGKTYLIKIYSYMNSISFYYTIKIDAEGNASVQSICYTEGETEHAEEKIEQ